MLIFRYNFLFKLENNYNFDCGNSMFYLKLKKLTANRLGWFEFRLCNIDNMEEATQECLDKTLLSV